MVQVLWQENYQQDLCTGKSYRLTCDQDIASSSLCLPSLLVQACEFIEEEEASLQRELLAHPLGIYNEASAAVGKHRHRT